MSMKIKFKIKIYFEHILLNTEVNSKWCLRLSFLLLTINLFGRHIGSDGIFSEYFYFTRVPRLRSGL